MISYPTQKTILGKTIPGIPAYFFDFVLAVFFIGLAFCSADFSYGLQKTWRPGTDSGIFLATAQNFIHGSWLYEDIFDNKPPLVYVLNYLALKLGNDGWHSMRVMEIGVMAFSAWTLYRIVVEAGVRRWLAVLGGIFFLLVVYQPRLIEGGNTSEEYALLFVLLGVRATARLLRADRANAGMALLAGALLGLAPITKEPFVLSTLPWIGFVLFRFLPRKQYFLTVMYLTGYLLPVTLWVALYVLTDRFRFILDYFTFNLGYVGQSSGGTGFMARWEGNLKEAYYRLYSYSRTVNVMAIAGLFYALLPVRKNLKEPALLYAAIAAMLIEFVGTGVSQFHFGHYYIQAGCGFFVVAIFTTEALMRRSSRLSRLVNPVRSLVLLSVCAALIFLDRSFLKEATGRLLQPAQEVQVSPVASYIRSHASPGATLWISSNKWSYLYIESGLPSPTRFAFVADLILVNSYTGSAEDKRQEVFSDLKRRPPQYIVWSNHDNTRFVAEPINHWILTHYRDTGLVDENAYGRATLLVYDGV